MTVVSVTRVLAFLVLLRLVPATDTSVLLLLLMQKLVQVVLVQALKVDLQVAFGRETIAAHLASERPLARV
jgi:hypothetical protein